MHTVGYWDFVKYVHKEVGSKTSASYGWAKSTSYTDTTTWQASVGASITAGYSVEKRVGTPKAGASATASVAVTVSAEYSRGGSKSFSESSSQQKLESEEIAPTASGSLWTWVWEAHDECGRGSLLTKSHAITPSNFQPPCCPPGLMKDASKPEGACLERKFCACDPDYCDLIH